jgi:hypothetical protein
MNTQCKSCRHAVNQHAPVPVNMRPGQGRWVTDDEYERRLLACRMCPALQADTCTHCGCLIQYRAALKDKTCPNPSGNCWLTD